MFAAEPEPEQDDAAVFRNQATLLLLALVHHLPGLDLSGEPLPNYFRAALHQCSDTNGAGENFEALRWKRSSPA